MSRGRRLAPTSSYYTVPKWKRDTEPIAITEPEPVPACPEHGCPLPCAVCAGLAEDLGEIWPR